MPLQDEGIIKMLWGLLTAIFWAVVGWAHLRLNRMEDKKVSKDQFSEFKEGLHEFKTKNEADLQAIRDLLVKIDNRLQNLK